MRIFNHFKHKNTKEEVALLYEMLVYRAGDCSNMAKQRHQKYFLNQT